MSLYTPAHFADADRAAGARLIHDHPFATLVTPAAPEPLVSHLPLLLHAACEPHGTLIGHFARANPHWQRATGVESIAIFHGPHAYVSPSWYAEPAKAVPTWNYATVHAHGMLDIIVDAAGTRAVLDTLVQRFEGSRQAPWTFAMPERQRDAMVGAIVAFRMRLRRLDVKFKLSQNRSADDRTRVAAALDAEGYADATATAEWMRRYAIPGPPTDGDR
jgi:transcriptional regulator